MVREIEHVARPTTTSAPEAPLCGYLGANIFKQVPLALIVLELTLTIGLRDDAISIYRRGSVHLAGKDG